MKLSEAKIENSLINLIFGGIPLCFIKTPLEFIDFPFEIGKKNVLIKIATYGVSVVKWVYYYLLLYNTVYPFPYAHRTSGNFDQKLEFIKIRN